MKKTESFYAARDALVEFSGLVDLYDDIQLTISCYLENNFNQKLKEAFTEWTGESALTEEEAKKLNKERKLTGTEYAYKAGELVTLSPEKMSLDTLKAKIEMGKKLLEQYNIPLKVRVLSGASTALGAIGAKPISKKSLLKRFGIPLSMVDTEHLEWQEKNKGYFTGR